MSKGKKKWEDVPEDAQRALEEWINLTEPDDEDRQRLADLFFEGGFTFGTCGHCNTEYQRGEPRDWGHFQGVHNDEGIGELCASCSGLYLSLKAFAEEE